jgi:hypothetical protein
VAAHWCVTADQPTPDPVRQSLSRGTSEISITSTSIDSALNHRLIAMLVADIDDSDLPSVEAMQERLTAAEQSTVYGAKAPLDRIHFVEHEQPPQILWASDRGVLAAVLVPQYDQDC